MSDINVKSTGYHNEYAQLYDALTLHKNYTDEVNCLERKILSKISGHPLRILSVGCGTGSHESILCGAHKVTGLDTSNAMITLAKEKSILGEMEFLCQDICDFDQGGYDVALSLFNVVNCLDSIESLVSFLSGISKSLKPKGILFFECWNGVACMITPPVVVVRNFDVSNPTLKRTATPKLDKTKQKLRINYEITGVVNGNSLSVESIQDITLFTQMEIQFALSQAGLSLVGIYSDLANGMLEARDGDRMISFICQKLEHASNSV